MFLRNKAFLFTFLLVLSSCATHEPEKVLTFSEQIAVDTKKAEGLYRAYQKEVVFFNQTSTERYLNTMAAKLAKQDSENKIEKVVVKIQQDNKPELSRFFSFPGTVISIPISFLKQVQFENELAAALAFELSTIMGRTLANHLEVLGEGKAPALFGKESLFNLTEDERVQAIRRGVRLLYFAGYDTRGMPSIFQRYPQFYVHTDASDLAKKEVNFNIREAQRAKSEILPSQNPIVRSDEFIQFKKELN